jgi:hypothetical protein
MSGGKRWTGRGIKASLLAPRSSSSYNDYFEMVFLQKEDESCHVWCFFSCQNGGAKASCCCAAVSANTSLQKKSAEVDGVSCLLLSLKKGCILAMLTRRGFREHISSKTEARKSMRCAATFLLLMLARYSKDAIDIIM